MAEEMSLRRYINDGNSAEDDTVEVRQILLI